MATPDIGKLDLSDSDNEDLFASPSRPSKSKLKAPNKTAESSGPAHRSGGSKYDAETAREAALQKELEGVRNINELIEGVLGSLDLAKGNMDTVSQTVTSASTLLNTWIRILSQTEHNQRLILNPNWRGASQDIADMENEQVLKAQAAERRAAEEERRRETARQRAEDEERQRQAGTTVRGSRGGRGRPRGGVSRTGSVSSSGYGRGSSTGSSAGTGRGGSGIGRGIPRGRARGVR
ncbi:a63190cd-c024-4c1e-8244-db98fe6e03e0 [Sclerotinia trifoliorum]|uniref:DASH complex subunit DUO1 n=1 Tax=Sclerotinia trifoliorum TaxID=28548 RepID=A0A8H2ZRP0_9HELO|nr:a63190cd-c024-4c1e-8244-db98fe6e03e0 [Sclerotinia trifoliorum]